MSAPSANRTNKTDENTIAITYIPTMTTWIAADAPKIHQLMVVPMKYVTQNKQQHSTDGFTVTVIDRSDTSSIDYNHLMTKAHQTKVKMS